jgi:hypothetical protein
MYIEWQNPVNIVLISISVEVKNIHEDIIRNTAKNIIKHTTNNPNTEVNQAENTHEDIDANL